jgi:hypothetical protein
VNIGIFLSNLSRFHSRKSKKALLYDAMMLLKNRLCNKFELKKTLPKDLAKRVEVMVGPLHFERAGLRIGQGRSLGCVFDRAQFEHFAFLVTKKVDSIPTLGGRTTRKLTRYWLSCGDWTTQMDVRVASVWLKCSRRRLL